MLISGKGRFDGGGTARSVIQPAFHVLPRYLLRQKHRSKRETLLLARVCRRAAPGYYALGVDVSDLSGANVE